jgi:hypothetical protein
MSEHRADRHVPAVFGVKGKQMQWSRTLTRLGISSALLAISCFGGGLLSPCSAQDATVGGTEIRSLVAHGGKLYAGNGYWEDESEGSHGAEILVLDHGRWRVDHAFDERMPSGHARHIAIATMGQAEFATDGSGKPLAKPVSMLLASTWDLTGEVKVYSRDDATREWTGETLAHDQRIPGVRYLAQVRSFGSHRDRVTGIDYVFAGHDPHGIFSGVYDPTVPGRIRWSQTPELDLSGLSASEAGVKELRVASFAECNGRLYATVGQQIYERTDGAAPQWRLIYANRNPGRSETGLRGLTAVPSPTGQGEALIAAVEGSAARIVRVDPRDGSEATELDLRDYLSKAWGMDVGYIIAAYNNMASVRDAHGEDVLLIGLEAWLPPTSQVTEGHRVANAGRGRLEGDAWYLIRHSNGSYDLRRVPPRAGQPMVSTRSIVADGDSVYFGGFDANKAPAHNTAWIVRSSVGTAVDGSH